jgi:short-subunit dehydrogenase
MTSNNSKTALITGASSGFGREFAKIFAKNGYNLILVARDEDKLQSFSQELSNKYPSVQADYFSVDLAQQGSADELYEKVKQQNLPVDILVNNAGVGQHGLFVDNETQKELDILHLNVISLMLLTKMYLREMILRKEGKILQVASIAGLMPTPKLAVYAASKAFVLSFTEALQNEIKDTGVTMTVLCPGASDTEFFERAHAEDTRIFQDTPLSEPEEVAQAGYEALMEGKGRSVPGLMNKIQAAASNLVPDSLLAAAMGKMMEEKK